jgi:hypothetical protein
VPGAGAVQVADLAGDPEPADALLEQRAHAREQIADAKDMRRRTGGLRALAAGSAGFARLGPAARALAQGCAWSARAWTGAAGAAGAFFNRSK